MRTWGARLGIIVAIGAVGLTAACSGGEPKAETKAAATTAATKAATTAATAAATTAATKAAATATAAATTAATAAATTAAAAAPINVDLSEFKVTAAATKAKAGKVSFKATNKGAAPHELAVIKSDLAADKLPQANGAIDEKAAAPAGRTKSIDGGKSENLEVTLAAGKYLLVCNLPAHYGLGMSTAFTVE